MATVARGALPEVKQGGSVRQGGEHANVVSLENRRLPEDGRTELSCQKWFDGYLAAQREQGHDTVEGVAVRAAGVAAGYTPTSLYVAANKRGLKGVTWSLTG